jgi:hypothetical protein
VYYHPEVHQLLIAFVAAAAVVLHVYDLALLLLQIVDLLLRLHLLTVSSSIVVSMIVGIAYKVLAYC